jgi:hypothetical protein
VGVARRRERLGLFAKKFLRLAAWPSLPVTTRSAIDMTLLSRLLPFLPAKPSRGIPTIVVIAAPSRTQLEIAIASGDAGLQKRLQQLHTKLHVPIFSPPSPSPYALILLHSNSCVVLQRDSRPLTKAPEQHLSQRIFRLFSTRYTVLNQTDV